MTTAVESLPQKNQDLEVISLVGFVHGVSHFFHLLLPLPAWSVLPLMMVIGYSTGIAGPSRDLLARRAATSRFGLAAYGRVYGFVYSGLDGGLALAPLLFGGLMDGGASLRY